eukprot:UN00599
MIKESMLRHALASFKSKIDNGGKIDLQKAKSMANSPNSFGSVELKIKQLS